MENFKVRIQNGYSEKSTIFAEYNIKASSRGEAESTALNKYFDSYCPRNDDWMMVAVTVS